MNYSFWKTAAVFALILGSLGVAGYAWAQDSGEKASENPKEKMHRPLMQGNGMKRGFYKRMEGFRHTSEEREQILNAIKDKDYQAWVALIEKDGKRPPHLEGITAENFEKFAELHELMERARQIKKELGMERPGKGFVGEMHKPPKSS